VMASGDDVFIAENTPLFAGATFVETKRAIGNTAGISLSPAQSCEAIRAGVATAVAAPARARPFTLSTPLAVTLRAQSPALADLFCQWPSFERAGSTEIRFSAQTVQAAVRMLNCCSAMSFMLR
jgi:D-amino peptidase